MSQPSKKVRNVPRSNVSPASQRTNSADNFENFTEPEGETTAQEGSDVSCI